MMRMRRAPCLPRPPSACRIVAEVKEVVDPLAATVEGLSLTELVIVVWKLQVNSACMHVHVVPQQLRRHDRALNVPPRPAATPRALPSGLARLARLPQREIARAALLARRRLVRSFALLHLRLRRLALGRLQLGVVMAGALEGGQVHVDRAIGLIR
eukprot:scaffold137143_cov27-Tisochrysis_lutea.AAC.2